MEREGVLTPIFIQADSIPEAHYKAVKAVWEYGIEKRTQYDRKNSDGSYLDPPGKDAQVIIHVSNPFSQPRYPPLSFCERGKYILEILGVKNHFVVPREELLINFEEGKDTRWPYAYSQRLSEFPVQSGTINQIENVIGRIIKDINTRRAVMTTRSPEIDTKLNEDIPCLGEVHFRCFENKGKYVLNMTTVWRSRDLFKAWPDNVEAVTYLGRKIANEIQKRTEVETILGGYTDFSNSLHIYGQDFSQIEGDKETGKKSFFEVFPTIESYLSKSRDSETAKEVEILPQMKELLLETEQWKFPEEKIELIKREIELLENGLLP
jgi:thymidylate synthase